MKHFKKPLAVLLSLLIALGSIAAVVYADGKGEATVTTKFYRYDDSTWKATSKAAPGDKVKAEVYLTTDFVAAGSTLVLFASKCIEPDYTSFAVNTALETEDGVAVDYNNATKLSNLGNMGSTQLSKVNELKGGNNLIFITNSTGTTKKYDGSKWSYSLEFTVKNDVTVDDKGILFAPPEFAQFNTEYIGTDFIKVKNAGEAYYSVTNESGSAKTYDLTVKDASNYITFGSKITLDATTNGTVDGKQTYEQNGIIGSSASFISSKSAVGTDGNYFKGWSTDGTTPLTSTQLADLKFGYEDSTYTAVYGSGYSYNVYYYADNSTSTFATENYTTYTDGGQTKLVVPGVTVTVSAKEFTGKTYDSTNPSNVTSGQITTDPANPLTLKLYYTTNSYTVIYKDSATQSELYRETVKHGEDAVGIPSGNIPAHTNYQYDAEELKNITAGKDISVTVTTDPTYDVTYSFTGDVPNDAIAPETKSYYSGETCTVAAAATTALSGYTFEGWTKNGVAAGDSFIVTGATTIEGNWVKAAPADVTVTYYDENDNPIANGTFTGKPGDPFPTASVPAVPEKDGYTSNGWDHTFTVYPDSSVSVKPNAYSPIPSNEVTITLVKRIYNDDGLTYNDYANTPATVTGTKGQAVQLPAPTAIQYFDNTAWKKDGVEITLSYTFNEDCTLYCEYRVRQWSLKFVNDDDSLNKDCGLVIAGSDISSLYPANPSKDGFVFAGWDFGNGKKNLTTMPDENTVAKAKFVEPQEGLYSCTFYVDNVVYDYAEYETGAAIVIPSDPAKFGKKFTGWSPEVPATMGDHNLEFTAQFEGDSTFTGLVIGGTIIGGTAAAAVAGANTALITGASIVGGIAVITGAVHIAKRINENKQVETTTEKQVDSVIPATGSQTAGIVAAVSLITACAAAFVMTKRKKDEE